MSWSIERDNGFGIPKELMVKHSAYSIARWAIIEALDALWMAGYTKEAWEQALEVIQRYSLMIKDLIVDETPPEE